jgi:hypothetical protein
MRMIRKTEGIYCLTPHHFLMLNRYAVIVADNFLRDASLYPDQQFKGGKF